MIGGDVDPVGSARVELKRLFPQDEGFQGAMAWAREVLSAEGIDPDAVSLRSVRALRKHDRRLSRTAARYLADTAAAGKEQGRSVRPFNPHLE